MFASVPCVTCLLLVIINVFIVQCSVLIIIVMYSLVYVFLFALLVSQCVFSSCVCLFVCMIPCSLRCFNIVWVRFSICCWLHVAVLLRSLPFTVCFVCVCISCVCYMFASSDYQCFYCTVFGTDYYCYVQFGLRVSVCIVSFAVCVL